MTIQQFIEKAYAGGWEGYANANRNWVAANPETILLDPLAWKAVGKVEEWNSVSETGMYTYGGNSVLADTWKCHMHRMIDALAEGKTIEQFLETL